MLHQVPQEMTEPTRGQEESKEDVHAAHDILYKTFFMQL